MAGAVYPVVAEVDTEGCEVPSPCGIPGQVGHTKMVIEVDIGEVFRAPENQSEK